VLSASDGPTVVCQVLTGLGGIGKTQLAANLAHRVRRDQHVDLLIWATATSRSSILATYAEAAADVTGIDNTDQRAPARLLAWLANTDRRWLIILDDLTNPGDLNGLWPPQNAKAGGTVVTTRRRDEALSGHGRQVVDVDVFTPPEAAAYLQERLKHRPAALDEHQELAADVGHLPLALVQATTYLADRQLTCARYRRLLAERRTELADLLPEHQALPDDQTATVSATWSLSIELADQLTSGGLARPMLTLAALLDSNGIPSAVLTAPPVLAYLTDRCATSQGPVDADTARQTLACLHRLSLANVDLEQPAASVRIHALVQRVTRDRLGTDELTTLARVAADALLHAWPDVERDTSLAQTLRANTNALHTITGEALWTLPTPMRGWRRLLARLVHVPLREVHPVLARSGASLEDAGLVGEARDYFFELYTLANQHLSLGHHATLDMLARYANCRGTAGDAAGAVAALELLLPVQLRVLGPDHPATLAARSNRARWLGETGDAGGALIAGQKVLADTLRVLGPDHPHTLGARGNVAFWRGEAGDDAGAVAAYQELLADLVRLLGPDHPTTLDVRHDIAHSRGGLGDTTGAIAAYEELLADRLRVLGPDHPSTLINRHNLASQRAAAGDTAGAVAAYKELLADELRVLGPDHPYTLITRDALSRRGAAPDG
jgi:hypothetical protein